MEYAARHPGDPTLKGKFVWSVGLHGLLALAVTAVAMYAPKTENWGSPGAGNAVPVGMVRSVPGIPLPRPETTTNSRVVDETHALYKAPAPPKPIEKTTNALEIPKFEKEKRAKPPQHLSRLLEDKTPPPPNAVPEKNAGGAPSLPYAAPTQVPGQFTMGAATPGGLAFTGAGASDFGSRYGWFVDAVRNRISSNWLQSSIDPSIRFAPRAVVTFTILRDGSITNIQIMKSSGYPSVDDSARRAILSSSPVSRLPNDFFGSTVNVEFWFDFHR